MMRIGIEQKEQKNSKNFFKFLVEGKQMKDRSLWPPSLISVLTWLAGAKQAQVFTILPYVLSKLRTSVPENELLLIYLYKD